MSKLSMSLKHRLSQEEALSRIKLRLSQLKNEHGDKISDLRENWSGNSCRFSFKAKGFTVFGTLEVGRTEVTLNGELPFLAGMFKGTIEETIRQHAQKLLA